VQEVTADMPQENFLRIKREVQDLVDTEMKRITNTPGLKKYIVKN